MQPEMERRDLTETDTSRKLAASDAELVVVSNRQPYSHSRTDSGIAVERPTGGLTQGLDPTIRRMGGTWIAWGDGDADRSVVDESDCIAVPPDEEQYSLRRVWLSESEVTQYYYGFSNQVLWPLCHSLPSKIQYERSFWHRYQQVNEYFADAVVDEIDDVDERPVVWFHDYHLALSPSFVRSQLGAKPSLLHFWHIPWPEWDIYRLVPNQTALLRGLLANDKIAFHVPRYCHNFLSCVESAIESAAVNWQQQTIRYDGREISVSAIPMGVSMGDIQAEIASVPESSGAETVRSDGAETSTVSTASADTSPSNTRPISAEVTEALQADGMDVVVGVDRLDYTKGIVRRLGAFERLLERNPELHGSLIYVEVGSESRSQIPAYQQVQDEVAESVSSINDRYETDDWSPVVYTTDRIPRQDLLALYRKSDVALVTPIRDGLNLVAQEFVAAQTESDGVLLLSEGAGAHQYLGQHAVTINPYDADGVASAIETALVMPRDERRRRMRRLQQQISKYDLQNWITTNLSGTVLDQTTEMPSQKQN